MSSRADHPRMRGEHGGAQEVACGLLGSSPHARGTHNKLIHNPILKGIIPACAGNTGQLDAGERVEWDHPRMRGEHESARMPVASVGGSSPHARGTRWRAGGSVRPSGIIPARAGNTQQTDTQSDTKWDHPRMRGEHESARMPVASVVGSSPHARGTRKCRWDVAVHVGIIPACAGNTISFVTASDTLRDHPRMRGEHANAGGMLLCMSGSSPHARGTQLALSQRRIPCGIIPACAGNTRSTARC